MTEHLAHVREEPASWLSRVVTAVERSVAPWAAVRGNSLNQLLVELHEQGEEFPSEIHLMQQ